MKDETIETMAGLGCLTFLGAAALVIDGSLGESIMVAIAAGFGAFVRHVWPSSVTEEVNKDAEEVSE